MHPRPVRGEGASDKVARALLGFLRKEPREPDHMILVSEKFV